jgi:hypothetical protein
MGSIYIYIYIWAFGTKEKYNECIVVIHQVGRCANKDSLGPIGSNIAWTLFCLRYDSGISLILKFSSSLATA